MKFESTGLRGLALALVAIVATATQVSAQDGGRRSGFTFGLLGFSGETPYGFRENVGFPLIEYENDYFKIGVPTLDVKLPWISSERLSFGLSVDFFGGDGAGYKPSDAPILNGMAKREGGIWAGGTIDWRTDVVDLSFKAMTDASDKSGGSSVQLEASRMFFLGERFTVTPKLGAIWMDDKAIDYFYGVRPSEATATRAAYTGKSTVNVRAGVTLGYMLAERHMLMMDIGVTQLGSGITDSPIVVNKTLTTVGLGYVFKF